MKRYLAVACLFFLSLSLVSLNLTGCKKRKSSSESNRESEKSSPLTFNDKIKSISVAELLPPASITKRSGKLEAEIKDNVKELVDFSYHDLTSEKFIAPTKSVFVNFDLILCRNVLIYFSRTLQDKVFNNFTNDLNKKGYLVLGETETLPDDFKSDFVCVDSLSKIYQKR